MPIFMDGKEYQDEAALEVAMNPVIPESLKKVYIYTDPEVVKPDENATSDQNEMKPDTVIRNQTMQADPSNVYNDQGDIVDYDFSKGQDLINRMPLESPEKPADALKPEVSYPSRGLSMAGAITDFIERQKSYPGKIADAVSGMMSGPNLEQDKKILTGIWEAAKKAFTLPGDVAQGNIDPSSPEAVQRAFDLAGFMVFGPAPVAKKMADGTLGSFVGVQSKTFNRERLRQAQQMEAQGLHPDEIWRDTQTFRGIDGRWRQEISDKEMKLTALPMKDGTTGFLREFVDHPELYRAYPELRNIQVKIDNKTEYIGSFNTASNTFTVNLTKLKDNETLLDVLVHEIQHKIQAKEGFAGGSNPKVAFEDALQTLRKKIDEASGTSDAAPLMRLYTDMLTNKKQFSNFLYESIPGEVEANLTMMSRRLSDVGRQRMSPAQRQEYLEGSNNPISGGTFRKPSYYGVSPEIPPGNLTGDY